MAGDLILVVEDNEKNLKLVRDAAVQRLSHARSRHRRARPDTAMEHVPSLILMDIPLPDIDGVTALGRLRADPGPPRFRSWR